MKEFKEPAVSPRSLAIVANTFAERRSVLVGVHGSVEGVGKSLVYQQLNELDTLRDLVFDALVKESY